MNLGQCVPAEWAQDRMPVRHVAAYQAGLPPMGRVRHVVDGLPPHSEEVLDRVRRRAQLAPPKPPPEKKPPPALEVEPKEKSATWPRGKTGARYELLRILGKSPALTFGSSYLSPRLQRPTNEVCPLLRLLAGQKLIRQSGAPKSYRYQITSLGLQALKA